MEQKFDQLMSAKIKRLGKFATSLDEPTFNSSDDSGLLSNEVIFTTSSHTYHYDAVKVGDKSFYISEFGKVYTGEVFRGLIIISNKSSTYPLTNVEFSVHSTLNQKNQVRSLAKETIDIIDRGASYSKIIEVRADYTDTYVIEVKAKYK